MKYHSPMRGRPDYLMLWFYLIWTCILTLLGCSSSVREDLPISSDVSLLDPEARGIKRERVWYQLWLATKGGALAKGGTSYFREDCRERNRQRNRR